MVRWWVGHGGPNHEKLLLFFMQWSPAACETYPRIPNCGTERQLRVWAGGISGKDGGQS